MKKPKLRFGRRFVSLLTLGLFLLMAMPLQAQISPSHVFQNSQLLRQEVLLILKHQGHPLQGRELGMQFNKLPIHVYSKTLEVAEKVSRAQSALGLSAYTVPVLKPVKISPAEVFVAVSDVVDEVRRIKSHLGITAEAPFPEFVDGKIPADVFENMWEISFLLDPLAGSLTPNLVVQRARYAQADLAILARNRSISLGDLQVSDVEREITPRDVLQECYKNLYRLAKVQRKAGMEPFVPPKFPPGDVIPSDPYDAIMLLLAETARLKHHLGVTEMAAMPVLPSGMSPKNAFGEVQKIAAILDPLQ